jgi:hypothetical protein
MAEKRVSEFQVDSEPVEKKAKQCEGGASLAVQNSNLHLVKRWYLANNGYSITVTIRNNKAVVIISDLTSLFVRSPSVEFIMSADEAMKLFRDFKKIEDASKRKQNGGFVIDLSSTQPHRALVVKLGEGVGVGFGGGYGLRLYRKADENKPSQHVFISPDSIQKISRAQKFIIEHLNNILDTEDDLEIMTDELVAYMKKMVASTPSTTPQPISKHINDLLETITNLELKKDIFANFDRKTCGKEHKFNKYVVYNYCTSQMSTLIRRWNAPSSATPSSTTSTVV